MNQFFVNLKNWHFKPAFFGTENACFLTEDKIYVILEKKIVEVLK